MNPAGTWAGWLGGGEEAGPEWYLALGLRARFGGVLLETALT